MSTRALIFCTLLQKSSSYNKNTFGSAYDYISVFFNRRSSNIDNIIHTHRQNTYCKTKHVKDLINTDPRKHLMKSTSVSWLITNNFTCGINTCFVVNQLSMLAWCRKPRTLWLPHWPSTFNLFCLPHWPSTWEPVLAATMTFNLRKHFGCHTHLQPVLAATLTFHLFWLPHWASTWEPVLAATLTFNLRTILAADYWWRFIQLKAFISH